VNRADLARTYRARRVAREAGRPVRWVSGAGRYALGVSTRAQGRPPRTSKRGGHPPPKPAFELAESKLRAPVARTGIVPRAALIDRLARAHEPPVISVVAPPGYGKTTVLSQWAEHRQPRVAWVSADVRDNDPAVLLTYIAVAIDRIERINPAVFRAFASPAAAVSVPLLLVSAIAAFGQPPGDRRPPLRLTPHREDAGDLGLPQARRLLPQRAITRMHELGLLAHA
jgi:hypothetical protein